ncbi:MAG TPA: hypothetical protein PLV25_02245, partial [Opitutales bacterium]|nr:hypothetical protein [Opitutales bacterium]
AYENKAVANKLQNLYRILQIQEQAIKNQNTLHRLIQESTSFKEAYSSYNEQTDYPQLLGEALESIQTDLLGRNLKEAAQTIASMKASTASKQWNLFHLYASWDDQAKMKVLLLNSHPQLVSELLQSKDSSGRTPIEIAAEARNKELAEYMQAQLGKIRETLESEGSWFDWRTITVAVAGGGALALGANKIWNKPTVIARRQGGIDPINLGRAVNPDDDSSSSRSLPNIGRGDGFRSPTNPGGFGGGSLVRQIPIPNGRSVDYEVRTYANEQQRRSPSYLSTEEETPTPSVTPQALNTQYSTPMPAEEHSRLKSNSRSQRRKDRRLSSHPYYSTEYFPKETQVERDQYYAKQSYSAPNPRRKQKQQSSAVRQPLPESNQPSPTVGNGYVPSATATTPYGATPIGDFYNQIPGLLHENGGYNLHNESTGYLSGSFFHDCEENQHDQEPSFGETPPSTPGDDRMTCTTTTEQRQELPAPQSPVLPEGDDTMDVARENTAPGIAEYERKAIIELQRQLWGTHLNRVKKLNTLKSDQARETSLTARETLNREVQLQQIRQIEAHRAYNRVLHRTSGQTLAGLRTQFSELLQTAQRELASLNAQKEREHSWGERERLTREVEAQAIRCNEAERAFNKVNAMIQPKKKVTTPSQGGYRPLDRGLVEQNQRTGLVMRNRLRNGKEWGDEESEDERSD